MSIKEHMISLLCAVQDCGLKQDSHVLRQKSVPNDEVVNHLMANGVTVQEYGTYRVDGHHLRFDCCYKTLAVLYNESDNMDNLCACPFCGARMEGLGDG